ncbi:MAG: hypothetical protein IJG63_06650 [Oscillospiraceae bacterium]|nr:hypothetical protein [Oscillospiraceae bacterium]
MIELTVKIDDVDYYAIADMLLPHMADYFEQNQQGASFARMLFNKMGKNENAAKAVISVLPPEVKDEITAWYINRQSEKIAGNIMEFFKSGGFSANVSDIHAKAKRKD